MAEKKRKEIVTIYPVKSSNGISRVDEREKPRFIEKDTSNIEKDTFGKEYHSRVTGKGRTTVTEKKVYPDGTVRERTYTQEFEKKKRK